MSGSLLEILAREKLDKPREWTVWRWEAVRRHGETIGWDLTGSIQTGWSTWGREQEVALFLSNAEIATLTLAWEQRTGYCPRCQGRGQTVARISAKDGTSWRDCSACAGSGKSATHPEAWTPWVEEPPLFAKRKKVKRKKRDKAESRTDTPTKRALREIKQFTGAWVA